MAKGGQGSSKKESTAYDKFSKWAHVGLSGLGTIPAVGAAADIVDLAYTAAEMPFGKSDGTDLALAAGGVAATFAPVVGDGAAAGLKITARLGKGADDVADNAIDFYRGAKPGIEPGFVPRPGDFKIDPRTGLVKDTHGVSVFDNPLSVSSKGFVPHADANGPRQGSYLRGRNAIAALFPTTDVAGNTLRYDGDITLYGGAGVKTLFGGDIQMLTPGGGQVFGVEGAAPPSTAGIVTQGAGNIQLYSQGSIQIGRAHV